LVADSDLSPAPDESADGQVDRSSESNAEIARLRERVAFYESFDRVIADNVARSSELLRQAMDRQAGAVSGLTKAQEEQERQREQELSRQRVLLAALLDDITQLQGQAERLARRVADALDEVESELPAGDDLTIAEPAAADAEAVPPEIVPFDPDAPVAEAGETTTEPRQLTVLAHRLPNAAAARSLREHLAGLAHVSAVEPREFADGVMRLEVTMTSALTVDDLRGWVGGGDFEPITQRADLIEIRLPAESPTS
jgi:hypothetical protein